MSETIPVTLPDEVLADVEAFSTADGVTRDALVRAAVEGYIVERKFYELRSRVVPQARAAGYFTDEDVFRDVS